MAIVVSLETTDFEFLRKELASLFTKPDTARILKAALDKAIAPVVERLRANTPVGPTGNLKRAVQGRTIPYPKDGNAVGLVGYRAASREASSPAGGGGKRRVGKDRGFHQYIIEGGAKERTVSKAAKRSYQRTGHSRRTRSGTVAVASHLVTMKADYYIASSFSAVNFRFKRGAEVQTEPPYPAAFFKRSNQPIQLPAIQPGGRSGRPPLATTWSETGTQAGEILLREVRAAISQALDRLSALGEAA